MNMRLEIGDEVSITVKGKVTDVSDAHGLCYEIEIPQKDYNSPRKIWLEEDEVNYLPKIKEKVIFEIIDEERQIVSCKVLNDKTGEYEETSRIFYLTHEQLDNLIPDEPRLVVYESRK